MFTNSFCKSSLSVVQPQGAVNELQVLGQVRLVGQFIQLLQECSNLCDVSRPEVLQLGLRDFVIFVPASLFLTFLLNLQFVYFFPDYFILAISMRTATKVLVVVNSLFCYIGACYGVTRRSVNTELRAVVRLRSVNTDFGNLSTRTLVFKGVSNICTQPSIYVVASTRLSNYKNSCSDVLHTCAALVNSEVDSILSVPLFPHATSIRDSTRIRFRLFLQPYIEFFLALFLRETNIYIPSGTFAYQKLSIINKTKNNKLIVQSRPLGSKGSVVTTTMLNNQINMSIYLSFHYHSCSINESYFMDSVYRQPSITELVDD